MYSSNTRGSHNNNDPSNSFTLGNSKTDLPVVLTKANLVQKVPSNNNTFSSSRPNKVLKQRNVLTGVSSSKPTSLVANNKTSRSTTTHNTHCINNKKSCSTISIESNELLKPSRLVMSLSSNSPTEIETSSKRTYSSCHINDEVYYESILDRTLRGSSGFSKNMDSVEDKPTSRVSGKVLVSDSGSQTSEDFHQLSFIYRRQSPYDPANSNLQHLEEEMEKVEWSNLTKGSTLNNYHSSRALSIRPSINMEEFFRNDSTQQEDNKNLLSTSPLSNFSNEFPLEPPNHCLKPTPKRGIPGHFLSNMNSASERFNCGSSDGGGSATSSASSFSTMPSNLSSPSAERIQYNNYYFDKSQLPWSNSHLNYRGNAHF
ncbi:hypothetical protein HDU92_003269 [Lobulomyces angularis]|nr:hypothetical protein HDU92_003269 [Lobulomyces angularis]